MLSGLIVPFLYQHTFTSSVLNEMDLAINLLIFNAPYILIVALMQVQNATLQGMKLSRVPLFSMLIAGVVKIVVMLLLTPTFTFNIYGVALANVLFYVVAFVLNDVYLHLKLGWKMEYRQILPCVLASGVMALYLWVGTMTFKNLSVYMQLPLLVLVGASVYFATLWVSGGAPFFSTFVQKFKNRVYKRKRS